MVSFELSHVNAFLAHKQHLLPGSRGDDLVQTTRDIVALHATSATTPYLSLWARINDFRREMLDDALYERRNLAKVLCMRVTVHTVPRDEVPLFMQAYRSYVEKRTPPRFRGAGLLVQAGLCQEDESADLLLHLQRRVISVLSENGPSTTQEIIQAVPELASKIRHDIGKPYEGEFSIGSRLMNSISAQGIIIRARPRGTWRSNLHEYATLGDWLPDVDLAAVTPEAARAAVVHRYLSAFGPTTLEDIQWWTGFGKRDMMKALEPSTPDLTEVSIEGLEDSFLMFRDETQRVAAFEPPDHPYAFFLPSLDPYIMGFHARDRFLGNEHCSKVFDRAGNALPTVWVNGRVVGAWDQSEDGSVTYGLFEDTCEAERHLLRENACRLGEFLGDTFVKPAFFHTSFTRSLTNRD